jgi:protein-S-isoprenylcysteine O-methyltransferase Ste14
VSSWSIVPGCVRSAVRLGNWLSLAICAVIPLVGLLPRIAVEETELARVLGDQYRSYQKATRRLVPGLW